MTKRLEFSAKTKLARFEHAKGHCENCGDLITGVAEYDHAVEAYLGGDNSFENCRCYCRRCHARKTKQRRPEIDKTRRILKKRTGVKSGRGFQKPPPGYDSFKRKWRED
jgi:5-methylcytosine-specific restriction endonuclease McrA